MHKEVTLPPREHDGYEPHLLPLMRTHKQGLFVTGGTLGVVR